MNGQTVSKRRPTAGIQANKREDQLPTANRTARRQRRLRSLSQPNCKKSPKSPVQSFTVALEDCMWVSLKEKTNCSGGASRTIVRLEKRKMDALKSEKWT